MDSASLIPSADALPVAWPWLKAMLIPCFGVHLLFMNALVGTGVIGWVHTWRSNDPSLEPARGMGKRMPFYMAFTINFGVAALLFLQVLYGHFFFTSSILTAVWWLSALALVLTAYGVAYWIDLRLPGPVGIRRLAWTVLAAALLLTAFVFVNNLTLMQDPGAWSGYFKTPGGTLWHWTDATLIPRYLHFVTASVAVGGLALALAYRHGPEEKRAGGMRWFTSATALQFLIGGWFFISLPSGIRSALMGGDVMATAFFVVALSAVVMSLVFGIRQRLWPAVGAAIFTVLAMVLVRDAIRTMYLAPFFNVGRLTVRPQYSPMAVFGLFLVLGAVAIGYMIRLYLKAKGAGAR
jgi:hypothetical protein